jgi:RAB protein geranylgeranyltransferase component A
MEKLEMRFGGVSAEPDANSEISQQVLDLMAKITRGKDRNEWSKQELHGSIFLSQLLSNSRKFSIEMIPKLLFCGGDMVDLIVKSRAGGSLEFQMPKEINIVRNGVIVKVFDF